jgi:transcriptional antiterminator Rof (Rho-off)
MMSDYRPVGCDAHSVLELLAMRRCKVRVTYLDHSEVAVVEGVIVDLLTRSGAEFLVMTTPASTFQLRLDRLQSIHDGADEVFRRQDPGSCDLSPQAAEK